MKSTFINNLQIGTTLDNEPFLLRDAARRTTKNGSPFLLLTISDKTGECGGVFWDVPAEVDGWVKTGKIAAVTGRVVSYKDALQINVSNLTPADDSDMSDFLASSARPREEMIAELEAHIANLTQPWQLLVGGLLLDEEFLPRFANAPAARGMHHAYIGGLLEHTLSMASIADHLADHYPHVNKALLIAGTLLHDMGKVNEYSMEGGFSFSEDGRLVGHIVRAIVMIETAVAQLPNFPQDDLRQLIHLIASHHGKQEWGSPVEPKTIEAVLLHQIDLLDSRMQGFLDHVGNDETKGDWTAKKSLMFNAELKRPSDM